MAHLDLSDGKIKNARGIIWRKDGNEKLFLITQEFSGEFTVPGGAKDMEDEDLECTLRRELQEELGLKPVDYAASRIGWEKEYENLYRHQDSERCGKNTIIYPFLVHIKEEVPLSFRKGEIAGAIWLHEDEACNVLEYAPHMKEIFEIGIKALDL
jgi:8-oxo-dGTP pyrophosphatase MutT (NUDIX family)